MGFLDALLGRSKPQAANLDALFAVPQAALTLEVARRAASPPGIGAVCYRANEGAAFATAQDDVQAAARRRRRPGRRAHQSTPYGFTWLVCRQEPDQTSRRW